MKTVLRSLGLTWLLAFSVLAFSAPPALGDTITWTLTDANLYGIQSDVTGSFVYSEGMIVSWSFNVPADVFYPNSLATSVDSGPGSSPIIVPNRPNGLYYYIPFPEGQNGFGINLLSGEDLFTQLASPGRITLAGFDFLTELDFYVPDSTGGSIVGVADTPEPPAWLLLGTGGLMLLGMGWRPGHAAFGRSIRASSAGPRGFNT
ncbi:MAG TPA: hypothetical protein VIE13_03215 [Terriglobales bacterium]|jgi:hypothetical protein